LAFLKAMPLAPGTLVAKGVPVGVVMGSGMRE
jgi:hypothetical protein